MAEYYEINDFKEVLFTKEQIADMTERLGKKITQDFSGKPLMVMCQATAAAPSHRAECRS